MCIDIQQELDRARFLLRPERAKTPWQEGEPILPTESLGMLAGFGIKTSDPEVVASVYVLGERGSLKAALDKLHAVVPSEGMRVLHGINGPLFFFGYAKIAGKEGLYAKFRLSGLLSAFSGDE